MAAIDKIFVNSWEQYCLFRDWCNEQPPLKDKYGVIVPITRYLYKYSEPFNKPKAVFCAPYFVDAYLVRHCPYDFIQDELKTNYGEWTDDFKKKAYDSVMLRGGKKANRGTEFYWLSKEDFVVHEDGKVDIPGREKSTYQRMKEGKLYLIPSMDRENPGKHFRCIKHPRRYFNTPYGIRRWSITIIEPEDISPMWYHKEHNSWDYIGEFVSSEWSSNTAYAKTIRALGRLLRKWQLPIGTEVYVNGRYISDDYVFIITE